MALLSSQLRHATEQYWVRLGVWARLVLSAGLAAGVVYLGPQAWRHAAEYASLHRAAAAPNFSPAQVDWLKKAFAAEPMNPETACAIGEALRIQSSIGGNNYQELAQQAIEWFGRGINLNRWGGYGYLGYGWCLDWLERPTESEPYFDRAAELDPNGYYTLAYIGLHYMQMGNNAAAKPWFERSLRLQWDKNPIARSYLQIIQSRLLEAATNEPSVKLNVPVR
jgi:tetratricopeptide (TPR) repeat protein